MAIQNFLNGGYYGKLGATVGQRWKNKRTIRTYVVPANPRTPTQQANRGKFADAVTYAQMGMQMNYYCTLFNDPNFTKWNYRMKVARELKNAGLSGLDLIPLYPISFNPPILLTEFSKATVTGQKHISFAAPDLALNADRVLSLMFALYDEQDTFLGYKLYLGYYYASNPGYVEVDVDDVDEINTHCFVRIISNDDEDSATDLIGSPRLAVGGSSIDIHTFNKTIRSVQKATTGITITFAEPWKGVPTINEIYFDLVCVVNGESVTLDGDTFELFENNGYCAVTFPYAGVENQMLPAFPLGSGLTNLTVDYEGASWQITIDDANEAYEDSDLARSFISTVSSISRSGTTFSVVFGETLPEVTSRNLTLAIRAVKNGTWVTENVAIASIDDDTITFEQSGASGANIYAFPSGATITLAGTITGNGVVYTADTQTAQSVSNADLSRSFSSVISSISRSGTTFTVTLGAALPSITSRNLTLAVRAVKNGAWVNENVTIASASGTSITFEQSGATGANIYAFPSGATLTLAGAVTGNGVTYTADTQTAQSVSNSDLTRNITAAYNEHEFIDDFDLTMSNVGFNVSADVSIACHSPASFMGATSLFNMPFKVTVESGTLHIKPDTSKWEMLHFSPGDYINIPSFSQTANGVSYIFSAVNNYAMEWTSTYSDWLKTLTAWSYEGDWISGHTGLRALNWQVQIPVANYTEDNGATDLEFRLVKGAKSFYSEEAYWEMDMTDPDQQEYYILFGASCEEGEYYEEVDTTWELRRAGSCVYIWEYDGDEITYEFPPTPSSLADW